MQAISFRVRARLLVKAHHDNLAQYSHHLEHEVKLRTAEVEASRCRWFTVSRGRRNIATTTRAGTSSASAATPRIIARVGFSEDRVAMLDMAAQLHDIGKIGIPDAVLLKPGKLDADEYKIMQQHCEYGRFIIQPDGPSQVTSGTSRSLLDLAADIAFTHHERLERRWLSFEDPRRANPLEGRITAWPTSSTPSPASVPTSRPSRWSSASASSAKAATSNSTRRRCLPPPPGEIDALRSESRRRPPRCEIQAHESASVIWHDAVVILNSATFRCASMQRMASAQKHAGPKTDWGKVANWYDDHVGEEGSEYHREVVLPGVIRLLARKR
jgi:hypothetical protein